MAGGKRNKNNNKDDDKIQKPAAADKSSSSVDRNVIPDYTVSGNDHLQSRSRYARVLSYKQLEIATEDFNNKLIITGESSSGTVYKGEFQETPGDGNYKTVAVKMLKDIDPEDNKMWLIREMRMLNRLCHPNIINLLGFSIECVKRALFVYEFMPRSLHKHLHDFDKPPEIKPLDWNKRMVIAHGVAKALEYLHNEARPPVIYMNLKAENILLNDCFQPKISDFGIAVSLTDDQVNNSSDPTESVVISRHAYSAPECSNNGKITTKCDVYSFGVVLLELITGRKAVNALRGNGKHYLPDWIRHSPADNVKLADPQLDGQFDKAIFCRVMELAFKCTREDPDLRPSTTDVVGYMDEFKSTKYKSRKEGVEREFDFDLNTIPNEEAIT